MRPKFPMSYGWGVLALSLSVACSSSDGPDAPGASAGSSSGGVSAGQGGAAAGSGGVAGSAAQAGSATSAGTGTTSGGGDATGAGGGGAGGGGAGGANGGGGSAGAAAGAAGAAGGSGGSAGTGGSAGGASGFEPCPATGDCKLLALGDSITFGTPTNNGGYRVKLFINAKSDNKQVTFVAGKTVSGGGSSTGPSGPSAAPNGPQMVMVNGMNVPFPRDNEGYPGITVGDLDARRCANGDGFTNMPNIVLLHIGTNDMVGSNASGAPAKLEKMIDDIAAAAPNALIAVASIIPLGSGNAAVMSYNSKIPDIVAMKASSGKHVIFVDQFKSFQSNGLSNDMVHPNDNVGYPAMGDAWYAAIKSYLR